jgi:predicted glycoside hydrolase/deacetylase ChbG (UPF0249 family)
VTLESLRGDLTENELDYLDDHQHLDSMPQITTNVTWSEASKGKEPILALLRDAGIQDIDIRVVQLLPHVESSRSTLWEEWSNPGGIGAL